VTDDAPPYHDDQNGRGAGGRFLPGNRHGKGNPHARQHAALREAMLSAVTVDDVHAVVRGLIEQARQGNVPAARELLDRVLGRPAPAPEEQPQAFCLHCHLTQNYGPRAPVDDV
jgi:hypothetical protein